MKSIVAMALLTMSLSSFATSIDQAVKQVEVANNAKCTHSKTSSIAKCFGIPKTCFYAVKFRCEANDGVFTLKVKVKDLYNLDTPGYITKVRGTKITR